MFYLVTQLKFENRKKTHAVVDYPAVCGTQQGNQREPSVKTLRYPVAAEFFEALRVDCFIWKHFKKNIPKSYIFFMGVKFYIKYLIE